MKKVLMIIFVCLIVVTLSGCEDKKIEEEKEYGCSAGEKEESFEDFAAHVSSFIGEEKVSSTDDTYTKEYLKENPYNKFSYDIREVFRLSFFESIIDAVEVEKRECEEFTYNQLTIKYGLDEELAIIELQYENPDGEVKIVYEFNELNGEKLARRYQETVSEDMETQISFIEIVEGLSFIKYDYLEVMDNYHFTYEESNVKTGEYVYHSGSNDYQYITFRRGDMMYGVRYFNQEYAPMEMGKLDGNNMIYMYRSHHSLRYNLAYVDGYDSVKGVGEFSLMINGLEQDYLRTSSTKKYEDNITIYIDNYSFDHTESDEEDFDLTIHGLTFAETYDDFMSDLDDLMDNYMEYIEEKELDMTFEEAIEKYSSAYDRYKDVIEEE